jgi:anti-anti-sigma factor
MSPNPSVHRLELPGDVLSTNVRDLRPLIFAEIDRMPAAGAGILELALEHARMVDSAGLNLIVSAMRAVGGKGGRMRVIVANGNVHRTFVFTRLDQHLELVKTGPAGV